MYSCVLFKTLVPASLSNMLELSSGVVVRLRSEFDVSPKRMG